MATTVSLVCRRPLLPITMNEHPLVAVAHSNAAVLDSANSSHLYSARPSVREGSSASDSATATSSTVPWFAVNETTRAGTARHQAATRTVWGCQAAPLPPVTSHHVHHYGRLPPISISYANIGCMADPLPPDLQAVLDHARQSAQRLAMDVIEYRAAR